MDIYYIISSLMKKRKIPVLFMNPWFPEIGQIPGYPGISWRVGKQGRIMGTLGPGRTSTMGPLGIIITITLLCIIVYTVDSR